MTQDGELGRAGHHEQHSDRGKGSARWGHVVLNVSLAARCTARHGVGFHAEPPTMECAAPVT
jgi:hypothetical protein